MWTRMSSRQTLQVDESCARVNCKIGLSTLNRPYPNPLLTFLIQWYYSVGTLLVATSTKLHSTPFRRVLHSGNSPTGRWYSRVSSGSVLYVTALVCLIMTSSLKNTEPHFYVKVNLKNLYSLNSWLLEKKWD